jgi:hypothetical protein
MLDHALAYAASGRRVLPIHTSTDQGRCSCGNLACPSVAKHPIAACVPHGVGDGTTDPAAIRAWWGRYPHANIAGVVEPSEVVVDIDSRVAADWLREHKDAYPLPPTVTAQSGRDGGGWHRWYATPTPIGSRTAVLAGIDLRGLGS